MAKLAAVGLLDEVIFHTEPQLILLNTIRVCLHT